MVVESPARSDVFAGPVPPRRSPTLRGAAVALLIPLVLMAVAGTLRFYRVDVPQRCYFDETYYYYDARDLLANGVERDFVVHPPLGKWMIAAGVAMVGVEEGSPVDQAVTEDPGSCGAAERDKNPPARAREAAESFARRAATAFFGTLWVGVTYLAAMRLFRRRGGAALAALLVAIDGIAFTMSRIAMLDVFLGFWVTVGFWLLLIDRDQQWAGVPGRRQDHSELDDDLQEALDGGPGPHTPVPLFGDLPRGHPFRWLAGIAFGLALATKWSAVLAIAPAGLFVLASELAWRKRIMGTPWIRLGRIVASGVVTLLVVPLVVYVLSYVPWFVNYEHTPPGRQACTGETASEDCPAALPARARVMARGWIGEQVRIYEFHRDLDAEHPYRATALTWPVIGRPVAYYYEDCTPDEAPESCHVAPGTVGEILGLGNPAIWWLALPAWFLVARMAIRRRDPVAWAILAFGGLQFLPWLASPRTVFLFYATPAVPFVCFALTYAAIRIAERPRLRWVPAAVAVLAVAAFLFWYPILSGAELPRDMWDLRIWIRPGWV
jgi:dolichyl-phosphate-mannose-protein mannosyltransferase